MPTTTADETTMDDPLYARARELVLELQKPSVAFLQRNFFIGYRRALGLMQMMEGDIVTAPRADGWRRMMPNHRKRVPNIKA